MPDTRGRDFFHEDWMVRSLRERFLPRLTSQEIGSLWQGATFLTEQAGGSDAGATGTGAERAGDMAPPYDITDTPLWRLYGDKWFRSNADAELALTLARPAGTRGLGLFLVPRWLPDGSLNGVVLHRLKDKLGARAMASGETTLDGAVAFQADELARLADAEAQLRLRAFVNRLRDLLASASLLEHAANSGEHDATLALAALHAARHLGPAGPPADPRCLEWLSGLADGQLEIGPDAGALEEMIAALP